MKKSLTVLFAQQDGLAGDAEEDLEILDHEGQEDLKRHSIKLKNVGSGSQGVVYLSIHTDTLRLVAIKQININEPSKIEMMLKELH